MTLLIGEAPLRDAVVPTGGTAHCISRHRQWIFPGLDLN